MKLNKGKYSLGVSVEVDHYHKNKTKIEKAFKALVDACKYTGDKQ